MSTLRSGPAAGTGLATVTPDGTVLDTWYPAPVLDGDAPDVPELEKLAGADADRGVRTTVVRTQIGSLAAPPADATDVYLRLHLLSHRLVRPHEVNLDGVFGLLANVVWTNHGPCAVAGFETVRARLRARGPVTVYGVDKFPRMVDYVVPSGVRIADADRVRLGAHLAEGTTVMHEGFVQLQRRHARGVDGGGPDLRRRGPRRRLGPRRRRVGHGDALGRRQGGHQRRRALPHRRQRRDRDLAGRRLRGRGGALRHGRHEGHAARRRGRRGADAVGRRTGCCCAATR